ncbi:MAG TPA: histidine kinase [Nocardioidaceae bacterium]|nr:histidine kinase [Nocardioidaceae bacterium]
MTRRSWAFDAAIALVVAALGVLEAVGGIDATHRQGPVWAQAALYVVTGGLLAVRRLNPIGVLTAILAVSTAEFAVFGSPEGQGVALPGIIAAYTIGRRVERRRSWWGLVLVVLLWLSWAGLDPMNDHLEERLLTLVWLSPWVIGWLVGALVRATRQTTEQRRQVREQKASRAVAEERNRIARELHDVIGHSVSVMTVQASAVRRRLSPDQVVERQALETVEAVGREALTEMRHMVGVLRHDGDTSDREPPPGLGQLDRLVEKFRAAGLPVEMRMAGPAQPLPPGLDLTAYRLVQEGLTNTLRHAPTPVRAEVTVTYDPGRLELAVRDDGAPSTAPGEAGHGLLGMRERVMVYGGDLVARPRTGGGFELVATLPLDHGEVS